jgi:hypothetical protein
VDVNGAEFISNPLLLLIIGALVSGLLIPTFTNRWQLHQKGMEIRIDIVSRIIKSVMRLLTLIESAKSSESMTKLELDKEYINFKLDSAVIGTELESYFPDEKKIAEDWDKLRNEIREFYEQYESIVKNSRGDIGKIDFQRKEKILKKKHDIILFVLRRPMPRFSLVPGFVVRSRLYKILKERGYIDAG